MRDTPIHVVTFNTGPVTTQFRKNAATHFERWINWRDSPRATQYEERLIARLYQDRGPDVFELPASAVTKKLVHALESKRPKPRYFITKATYLMDVARRILPTPALDWLVSKGG